MHLQGIETSCISQNFHQVVHRNYVEPEFSAKDSEEVRWSASSNTRCRNELPQTGLDLSERLVDPGAAEGELRARPNGFSEPVHRNACD